MHSAASTTGRVRRGRDTAQVVACEMSSCLLVSALLAVRDVMPVH